MTSLSLFSPQQAARLKAALWHGEPGPYLAAQYGCSLALIRAIARGYNYSEIEWPDGSTGAIKHTRLKSISRARARARREVGAQITKTLNARVRAILILEAEQ